MINNKPVVFYNVSYESITQYGEWMIKKMLWFFSLNCSEYIILWRPHPTLKERLFLLTDHSLYDKYSDLEKQFKNNKMGIFDNNKDIEWSINVADIYYGDPGTVYNEFKIRNKKAILQNNTGLFFPMGINLYNEKDIYGIDYGLSTIVKYNIENNAWSFCREIPQKSLNEKTYHQCIQYKNKMIFSPFWTDELMVYDTMSEEIFFYKLPLKDCLKSKQKSNFFQLLINDDILYLMPAGYRAIMTFDLISNTFKEFINLSNYIGDNEFLSFSYCTKVDDKLFAVASISSNEVLIANYKTGEFTITSIGEKEYRFSNIVCYEGCIWLTVKLHKVIIKWKYETNEVTILNNFPDDFEGFGGNLFNDSATLIYKDKLYCIPAKSNMGIIVDTKTSEMINNEKISKYTNIPNKRISVFDTHCHNEHTFFLQQQEFKFLIYDVKDDSITESRCWMDKNECFLEEMAVIKDCVRQIVSDKNELYIK